MCCIFLLQFFLSLFIKVRININSTDCFLYISKGRSGISINGVVKEVVGVEKEMTYILCFTITTILIGIIVIVVLLKNQKKKDLLIVQKQQEADQLKRKLDNAIEDIVQLAITANPSFIIRFRENYSEFYNNLVTQYPNLTLNDLKFCALIKLNFSNKEIAQYGNMSIRTVESKKYRLRKKLNLDMDINLNKWIIEQ
jgi:DNA-binding CsgD family transcriptional regulator